MNPTLTRVQSTAELEALYRKLVPEFRAPSVVLLSGPVGAGKTTSVQLLLNLLGIAESVASPSFAIHHRYRGAGRDVDHVDLYRLENEEDLESTGFWDLFSQSRNVVIVEWADRLREDVWPLAWRKISIHLELVAGQPEARDVQISVEN